MENSNPVSNPQPIPVQQPVLPVTPDSSIPQKKNRRRIAILISTILFCIAIMAVGFFIFRKSSDKSLVINGEEIPQSKIELITDYYTSIDDTEQKDAELFVTDLYKENVILKNQLQKDSIQFSSLKGEINGYRQTDQIARDYPEDLSRLLAENTVMKRHVIANIGVKSRTGEIIQMEVPVVQQVNTPNQEYARIMQSKLNLYKQLLDGGIPLENVKQRITQDSDLEETPEIQIRIFAFEKMTPLRPVFLSQDFVDKVYSTNVDATSDVFNVSGKDTITFGIAVITAAGEGEFNDYAEWLESKKKSLSLEEK